MECLKQFYDVFLAPLVWLASTLIGAGIGAHIAFKYQRHADTLKKREEQITALKIAQGAIHSHWASLDEIHEFLAANKSDFANQIINLNDIIRTRYTVSLDIPSIAFLFDHRKYANLIQELMLVEGASMTANSGMKRRAELIEKIRDNSVVSSVDPQLKKYRGDIDAVTGSLYLDLCESIESSTKDSRKQARKAFFDLKAAGEEIFAVKFLDLEDLPPQKT